MKRKRPALNARYGERLEALYEAIAERQNQELRALRDTGGMSVQDKVVKAVEASLGIEDAGANLSGSCAVLGGDSLAATAFATLFEGIERKSALLGRRVLVRFDLGGGRYIKK